MKTRATVHTHIHSQTHALTHTHVYTHTYACTHSTNEDGNPTISRLSSPSVSLPPAVTKSKKFEVSSFILSRCRTVPGSQAIKHKVTSHHHFSPSLFSSSEHSTIIFLPSFVSSVFNWTVARRWLLEIEFSFQSIWCILYSVAQQCIAGTEGELSSACAQRENVKHWFAFSLWVCRCSSWWGRGVYKYHSI